MKLKKYELVRAIDKVKSVVQKNPQIPALGGVLVKEGYAIAANGEMTIQVKLEGTEEESFIIPMKAFDLIKNLPEGDVEITCDDKDVVTIQMEKIKNSYQSFPAESFMYDKTETGKEQGIVLPGALLMEAVSHALYAAADKSPGRPELEGIYLEGEGDNLNLAATDGHVMCWDQIHAISGVSGLKLIVPKTAAKKLTSMGMDDDITLSYDANGAIFKTDTYLIRTRIRDGKYVPYQKMFVNMENYAIVNREELIGAMTRAKMCTDESVPAEFDIDGEEINVILQDKVTNYREKIMLKSPIEKPIRACYDNLLGTEEIRGYRSHPGADHGAEGAREWRLDPGGGAATESWRTCTCFFQKRWISSGYGNYFGKRKMEHATRSERFQ